jgi:peptide chain release factor 1
MEEIARMVPAEKLDQIQARFEYLEAQLNAGAAVADLAALSREYSELGGVVEHIARWRALLREEAEARRLLEDPELRGLAEEELERVRTSLPEAEQAVRLALLPKDAADARSAILEIRAGTGGDEAALFAADLVRMYQRLAERRGWRWDVVEETPTELGGLKELVAEVRGEGVYAQLKFESGVHRVQRVPVTESGGRIHTSAATVAVLPEAEEVDIEIPASDIRIDTMRASGAGGQHVNTTDSAVRITHLPTGIAVTSSEKSQHQNRAKAMQVLRARLYDMERHRQDSARAAARKGQVGSGDRSERIRTYNFPQGRLTDHRIGLTLYKLDAAMQGEIDEVIEALITADQADRLAEIEG